MKCAMAAARSAAISRVMSSDDECRTSSASGLRTVDRNTSRPSTDPNRHPSQKNPIPSHIPRTRPPKSAPVTTQPQKEYGRDGSAIRRDTVAYQNKQKNRNSRATSPSTPSPINVSQESL